MAELTLEMLAARIDALEKRLENQEAPAKRRGDWLRVIGMFDDDPELMEQVLAEIQAAREAERKLAREGRE